MKHFWRKMMPLKGVSSVFLYFFLFFGIILTIQTDILAQSSGTEIVIKPSPWYEAVHVKGYAQLRYNQVYSSNPDLNCEQCDASWSAGGLFFKRIRVSLYGNLGQHISYYIQPDFASSPATDKQNFLQLKDAYIDIKLRKDESLKIRAGLSKIPYGFENIQSSSRRLAFDRADGINSAVPNERDLGVIVYYTTVSRQKIYKEVNTSQHKGSGDYGVFALGIYNGQTANVPDKNTSFHLVARAAYPFKIQSQVMELGIQAFRGKYVLMKTSSGAGKSLDSNYLDQRAGITAILFPHPIGVQFEYNLGTGPEFNTVSDSIENQKLQGGYLLISYLIDTKKQSITPFLRGQYYDGGKKQELDARSYTVKELEFGIEWQLIKQLELTASYVLSSRRYEDFIIQDNNQKGSLIRLQAQVNF